MMPVRLLPLQPKDFASETEIRWCPGCGDYSILAQLKKVLAELGVPRERMVFLSGMGCAGRIPHYLRTYGFQTLPGRAIPVAVGLKRARPELQVWVVGGEGDLLQRGANHLLHAMQQNVDIKILLINNETLGLSRGQCSPTTRLGARTPTTPSGTLAPPIRPPVLALSAECSFVARTLDVDIHHLAATLDRAARHQGTAFVEIYQNCNIFNPDAFAYAADQAVRLDNVVYLEHGQPLIFGKDRDRTVAWHGLRPEVVPCVAVPPELRPRHDETLDDPTWALALARWSHSESPEALPEVLGVLRAAIRPVRGNAVSGDTTPEETGPHDVATMLRKRWRRGTTWKVASEGDHALPVL
jgi:2-oxoglutarate ferredoxin oxidoreductase subunit beta